MLATTGNGRPRADQALGKHLLEYARAVDRGVAWGPAPRRAREKRPRPSRARYAQPRRVMVARARAPPRQLRQESAPTRGPGAHPRDVFASSTRGRRDRLATLVAEAEQVMVHAAVRKSPSRTGAHFKVSAGAPGRGGGFRLRPDPSGARWPPMALARDTRDAWARGERPGTPTAPARLKPGCRTRGETRLWHPYCPGFRPAPRRRRPPRPLTARVGGRLSALGWR